MPKQIIESENLGWQILLVALLFSMVYVVLHYHVFGGVLGKDFPLFIFNKGISLAAFLLLTFNFTFGPLKNIGIKVPLSWLNSRNILGMTGFVLVFIHVFLSLILLKPTVYAKFFEPDGSYTLYAGLSMLTGIFAFVALWIYNVSFQTHLRENKKFIQFITSRKFLILALTLGAFHLLFMGFEGWLNPSGWNGGMLPVSLVAFLFFTVGFGINLVGRK